MSKPSDRTPSVRPGVPTGGLARPFAAQTRIGNLVHRSPLLAQLTAQARQSSQLLEQVKPLLPAPLRSVVRAGPVEGQQWCVIVPNSAVAAKLRHLAPLLLQALAQAPDGAGAAITSIRARVSTPLSDDGLVD